MARNLKQSKDDFLYRILCVTKKLRLHVQGVFLSTTRGCTTRTGYFKCREVKTGFYRSKSMQTGSSGTLIGWISGQTTFVPLWDRGESLRQIPFSHGTFLRYNGAQGPDSETNSISDRNVNTGALLIAQIHGYLLGLKSIKTLIVGLQKI